MIRQSKQPYHAVEFLCVEEATGRLDGYMAVATRLAHDFIRAQSEQLKERGISHKIRRHRRLIEPQAGFLAGDSCLARAHSCGGRRPLSETHCLLPRNNVGCGFAE